MWGDFFLNVLLLKKKNIILNVSFRVNKSQMMLITAKNYRNFKLKKKQSFLFGKRQQFRLERYPVNVFFRFCDSPYNTESLLVKFLKVKFIRAKYCWQQMN